MGAKDAKKKKKVKYIDDGHTVYSMEGLYPEKRSANGSEQTGLTRAERRAAIKAAFGCYLPKLALVILGFTLAMLVIYIWLH